MFEDLTTCDRCQGNACFITEINDKIKTYQCFGCGFNTNSIMKKGEKFFEEQIELLPNLHKELMGEDEDGKIWFPTTINIPEKGMVFANGNNAQNWKWAAVKAVPVKDEEKEKYPIPNKKGKYYKWRMDMTTLKEFEEKDFMEGLDFIGVFDK